MSSVRFQVENLPPVLDLLFDFLVSFELNRYKANFLKSW